MSTIVGPNGQPVPKQIQITAEQGLAVTQAMIEAQCVALINIWHINPQAVAEMLLNLSAALVAQAPPMVREQVKAALVQVFCFQVQERGNQLDLQVKLAQQSPSSPIIM